MSETPPAAPGYRILEAEDIELVSVGSGRRVALQDAVREGWVVCERCGAPYEPDDVADLREADPNAPCISDVCRRRTDALRTMPLPVERIVVFAQSRMHDDFRHGLLYQLFYARDEARIHPHFTLREQQAAGAPPSAATDEPTVREELWQSQGLVITKRRRGKFVSWVPIGAPDSPSAPADPSPPATGGAE